MKKLIVDENCICCGNCVAHCGEVFTFGEDGNACVKADAKIEENKESIENVINDCPTGAIKYIEEETKAA